MNHIVKKGEKAKFESKCNLCGKIIRGTNPSILIINKTLHQKWHEINDIKF